MKLELLVVANPITPTRTRTGDDLHLTKGGE